MISEHEKLVPKRIWARLLKTNERMMKSMSPRVITSLLKEKVPLEASLKQSYMSAKQKTKNTVISKLKQNSKSFFSFVKSKQNTRARVGLFLDPKDKSRSSHYS